ncbi:AAA family ATPase, partial [bacterium]|nr:AAA family ATPase [bacterium]
MKTLLVCINKGGVGKTLIACQLARYARQLGLKVLVIDFDDQGNTTKSLERDQSVQRLPLTVTQVMFQHEPSMKPDESGFSLLAADGSFNIALVEQARVKMQVDGEDVEKAVVAHQNFGAFLEDMQAHFDLCIIDGPPTGDVRITMALAQATAVVCPIQLAQESIEGMGDTLKGRRGILRVKAEMNPKLDFLGFLPNMVESTPKQRDALKSLSKALGEYFLRDEDGIIVTIPRRESLRDAQGQGA